MSDRDPVEQPRFRPAVQEVHQHQKEPVSPQTESAAYRLAFQDDEFLLRADLRPVRFQLELLKPELLLDEAKIASTFVFYGSARIPLARGSTGAHRCRDRRAHARRGRASRRQVALL